MIPSAHFVGAALAFAVALCLTGQALAIRFGTERGRANDALVTVFLMNTACFVSVVAVRNYDAYNLTPQSVAAFVGAGLLGTLLGTGFYYLGIERVGASRSDAIKASQPLTATLLAVLVIGEVVRPLNVVGIILVMAGVVVLVVERSENSVTATDDVGIGLGYPLLAAVFFGMEPTLAKIGFRAGTPVFVGLAVKTTAATAGLLTFLRWRGTLSIRGISGALRSKWYLVAGLMNTLSLVAYYFSLTLAPVSVVIPITQTSPLLIMAISYRYVPELERVTMRLVAGGLCIVAGAVVVLFG